MTRVGDSGTVVATWNGDWRATVTAGPFTFEVDEPEAAGGTFAGPMPTEYFLASLASCFTLAVVWSARKRGIELPDLVVSAVGEYEGPRYAGIRLTVQTKYDARKLEPLLISAKRNCYVSNTLLYPPRIDISVEES